MKLKCCASLWQGKRDKLKIGSLWVTFEKIKGIDYY